MAFGAVERTCGDDSSHPSAENFKFFGNFDFSSLQLAGQYVFMALRLN
jgi:hypothetical protein